MILLNSYTAIFIELFALIYTKKEYLQNK